MPKKEKEKTRFEIDTVTLHEINVALQGLKRDANVNQRLLEAVIKLAGVVGDINADPALRK
jgi:hypothetical protein